MKPSAWMLSTEGQVVMGPHEHSLICPLYLVNLNQIQQPSTPQLSPFDSMAKSTQPLSCFFGVGRI